MERPPHLANCSLSEREKAVLRFLSKVNRQSSSTTAQDIQSLYKFDWSDKAIYNAITVCALFYFCNRWIDATAVHPLSDEAHRPLGKGTADNSYFQ